MLIAALFTIAKKWKQPKCPSGDEWIKKRWYIHTMEYHSAIRRKQVLPPFATTRKELEGVILSEISQVEKDKYQGFHSSVRYENKGKTGRNKTAADSQTQEWTNSYQRERDLGGWVGKEG